MHFSIQPHLIRQDSTVPLRMMFVGWLAGLFTSLTLSPVGNPALAVMGFTFLAGGLMAAALGSTRTWRMLICSAAGGVVAWLGWRFTITDRLVPTLRNDPLSILDRDQLAALIVGFAVMSIGFGAILEAMRAQSEPGSSPLPIRIALIAIGMIHTSVICSVAGVSTVYTLMLAVVVGLGLAAMAFLRTERPMTDFHPAP